ncbi:alpha-L-fucosidase [Chitinophaga skermanii]|uniref:alpha-L-fucosidase n=1 Tax=Chitinophaga skermanii TaxID=331697 RepID=A0A327R1C1_9BACT|nr:alpha-L-fucosidase [Chitinophaga skermanii]RAJ10676.1 alpha-L-fucosidase [Chitinophaga skermanii]
MRKYDLRRIGLLLLLCVTMFGNANSQTTKQPVALKHGAHRVGKRTDADMAKWRSYGLGQFIHWGLYSILEGKYNGKYYNGAAEWIRSWKEVPHAEYDSLYKQFNPENFNPTQWAKMAKQMGVKYVTFTTKHHDGFCLWPSQYTQYTVANSPYKKDIVKQVVDAYTKEGIDVYLYFSVMDWSHPDWRTDLKTKEDSVAFDRFKLFTKNQLTELLKMYPQTKGLWFDGTWDTSWKKSGAFSDSLEQHLKSLIPGLIIGSRLRADEFGNRHNDANGVLMGDYEQGWERKIPKTYADVHGNDWDCVMTIPENGWGYAEKWLGHWKTSYECIEMTTQCVSLGGNFVLNFGPKADGTFRPEEITVAKEMGDWMKVNNAAIYDCEYANCEKQDWGYFTKKQNDDKIYMVVFNVPINGSLKVKLPKNTSIGKASLLQAPSTVLSTEQLDYNASYIQLPKGMKPTSPFVIVIDTKQQSQVETEQKAKT